MRSRTKAWRAKNKEINEALRALKVDIMRAGFELNGLKIDLNMSHFGENPESIWALKDSIVAQELKIKRLKEGLVLLQKDSAKHKKILSLPAETNAQKVKKCLREVEKLAKERDILKEKLIYNRSKLANKRSQLSKLRSYSSEK